MKTIIILVSAFIILSVRSESQIRISINGASVVPTGTFQEAVEVGFGGNFTLSYLPFNPYLEFSISSGYYYCGFKKDLPDYNVSYTAVPVLGGVRLNFSDFDFIPYVGVEAGVYFPKYVIDVNYGVLGETSYTTYDIDPGIAPYAGFRINLISGFDIDVNAKYNRLNTKYIARSFLLIQTGFAYRF